MPGKTPQKKCMLDSEKNVLKCKETDGSWKWYDVSASMLTSESKRVKDDSIKDMVNISSECFSSGKCKDSPVITVYKLSSCPACKAHDAIVNNMKTIFDDANIPITIRSVDARENIGTFKALKCKGTPCVSMKVGERKEKKIYEGNRSEISAIAEIFGLPNPLFNDIKNTVPKRLMT
jgi:hypothetical protein